MPRLFNTKLHSIKLANAHFWIGTLGILFYTVPLYWAGWTQSLMWKEFLGDGSLKYGNFLETVTQILPMYGLRAIGGAIYVIGVLIMVYNLIKTAYAGELLANEPAQAPARIKSNKGHKGEHWHRWIERRPIQLLVFSTIVVVIGGLVEIFPMIIVDENVPKIASVKPYTPLELQGRDLYIREGCVSCHSQMIRPFRSETKRYGDYSKSGEFIYDRPFLWGSKRTGPDLHRVGGKYNHNWHYSHMLKPVLTSPNSIMPSYSWLLTNKLDISTTPAKIRALQFLGTPYEEGYDEKANDDLKKQAAQIAEELKAVDKNIQDDELSEREIVALIAYLQRLGTDINPEKSQE
jgi:cytochrome c oxidase cbb3-type subunit I/II